MQGVPIDSKFALVGAVLMQLIGMVDQKARQKSLRYRCTREFTLQSLKTLVSLVCEIDRKTTTGYLTPIAVPTLKDRSSKAVMNIVGSRDPDMPIHCVESHIMSLYQGSDYGSYMSVVEEVHRRLRLVKDAIPYYHGDLLFSLSYPFVDPTESTLAINWDTISPRNETQLEVDVMGLNANLRHTFAKLVLSGVDKTIAISIAMDSKK